MAYHTEFDYFIDDATPEDFGNWLLTEAHRLLPITHEREKGVLFVNSELVAPTDEWPHYTLSILGDYYEDFELRRVDRAVSEVGRNLNYDTAYCWVVIKKVSNHRIQAIGFWQDFPELLEMLREQVDIAYRGHIYDNLEQIQDQSAFVSGTNENQGDFITISGDKKASRVELRVGEISLQRKRPGRKPDPENEIAFHIILDGNQSEEAWIEAFEYWCNKKNINYPDKRDRDAFKKAMKRAENRTNKTTN